MPSGLGLWTQLWLAQSKRYTTTVWIYAEEKHLPAVDRRRWVEEGGGEAESGCATPAVAAAVAAAATSAIAAG